MKPNKNSKLRLHNPHTHISCHVEYNRQTASTRLELTGKVYQSRSLLFEDSVKFANESTNVELNF